MTKSEVYSGPTTDEAFRDELTRLLVMTKKNYISVEGRSWECPADETNRTLDVEISSVQTGTNTDTR